MKKIFISLFLFCSTFSYGQWGTCKQSDAQSVKDRTLLVVVEEPNEDLVKKLSDEQKTFYTDDIAAYNAMMKELMPKYWYYGAKVEFKTRPEVEALVKSKSKDYAYLEDNKFKTNYYNKSALSSTMNLKNNKHGGMSPIGGDYEETAICVRLTDDNPLGNPVWGSYLPDPFPTNGQMVYGLKQLQLELKYRNDGKGDIEIMKLYKTDAKNLPNLTLLLDKDNCSPSDEEIKKCYPYPYQLVDKSRIDSAFINQEPGSATIIFIPRANNQFVTMVVQTNEGTEVGRTDNNRSTGFSASIGGLDEMKKESTKGIIRKDDLKIIAGQAK